MATPNAPLQTSPASTDIGKPVLFLTGHFARRTIRAQLDELQQAEVGRKCGTKDRRPLDPPPVVNLQLFEVFNVGTPLEEERQLKNLTEMDSHGFICHVDLFHVPDPATLSSEPSTNDRADNPPSHIPSALGPSTSGPSVLNRAVPLAEPLLGCGSGSTAAHSQTSHTTMAPSFGYSHPMGWPAPPVSQNLVSPLPSAAMNTEAELRVKPGTMNTGTVSENDQLACTQLLAGNTIATPSFIEFTGKDILFTFADLAVCEGGLFLPRYRTFNIFNMAVGEMPVPILAECYGGAFRVYSTQNFPGLRPSTELTKRLSTMGSRVITRENERKRRKSVATSRGTNGKMPVRAIAPAPFPATGSVHATLSQAQSSTGEHRWPMSTLSQKATVILTISYTSCVVAIDRRGFGCSTFVPQQLTCGNDEEKLKLWVDPTSDQDVRRFNYCPESRQEMCGREVVNCMEDDLENFCSLKLASLRYRQHDRPLRQGLRRGR